MGPALEVLKRFRVFGSPLFVGVSKRGEIIGESNCIDDFEAQFSNERIRNSWTSQKVRRNDSAQNYVPYS